MMRDENDKTRLSFWFPLIEAAGLPIPKTRIVRTELPLLALADGERVEGFDEFLAELRVACEATGLPCFLRTDFTSGKHDWKRTCFLSDISKLGQHVFNLVEFSECADILGLPTDAWVVREMLTTRPMFHAFSGRMPIVREFRFFVRDGMIEHIQPYWPADTIDGHEPDRCDWREILAAASILTDTERANLEALTRRANAVVPGFWSVDWLLTTDRGWVLTDMAEGRHSYRWQPSEVDTPAKIATS